MRKGKRNVLLDTCIMSSLVKIGRSGWLRDVARFHNWNLCTTSAVRDELGEFFDGSLLVAFGISVVEEDFALQIDANRLKSQVSRQLSETDIGLLALARRRMWPIWGNDSRLLRAAEERSVEVYRLFAPIVDMARQGHLDRHGVYDCGKRLAANDHRFTEADLRNLFLKLFQ